MNIQTWLKKNTADLHGKTVAVTGSTGGLGKELCTHLASLGASLILLDRNAKRSESHADDLRQRFPGIAVSRIPLDLEDLSSAAAAVRDLSTTQGHTVSPATPAKAATTTCFRSISPRPII